MDALLEWLEASSGEDPLIVASWFHHRFTQIHPYQDGNGRVMRALTTMILVQADLLPLVIDRDLRTEYLNALESADLGSLKDLVLLFARLERNAILQALSVGAGADFSAQRSLTSAVIGSLADKLARRQQKKEADLRGVNGIAIALRARSHDLVRTKLNELRQSVPALADARPYV